MSQTELAAPSGRVSQSREIQPTTAPITIISTPAAQFLSYAHPLILLSYFYLRFGALVADPTRALLLDLFPVALLQGTYAAICLPLSKKSNAIEQLKQATPTKSKHKPPRKAQQEAGIFGRASSAFLALLITTFATLPVFILLVLFGAPLTTHHSQTFLCAAHFSLLAIFPLFYAHGVERQAWWEIGGAMLPSDSVWGTSFGVAVGAWLGAIPIPLDWDREWQKWPVTIITGMYAGALFGSLLGRHVFYGKRLRFRPDESDHGSKQDTKKIN